MLAISHERLPIFRGEFDSHMMLNLGIVGIFENVLHPVIGNALKSVSRIYS